MLHGFFSIFFHGVRQQQVTDVARSFTAHRQAFWNPGQLGRERDPVLLQQTSISHRYLLPINGVFNP